MFAHWDVKQSYFFIVFRQHSLKNVENNNNKKVKGSISPIKVYKALQCMQINLL